MCNSTAECLKYLKQYENYDIALGDSRMHIQASKNYSPDQIYCFDRRKSLLTYQVSLLLRKGSKLEGKINQIIRRSSESGLFTKWNRDTLQMNHGIEDIPPLQMTLENMLMPVIFILGIGLPLSVFLFLMEHLVSRKMKKQSKSFIWILLDQLCNPDRLYFKTKVQSHSQIDECIYTYLE